MAVTYVNEWKKRPEYIAMVRFVNTFERLFRNHKANPEAPFHFESHEVNQFLKLQRIYRRLEEIKYEQHI